MRKSMEEQVKETDMQIVKQIADESYFKGYLDALYTFAWWKDGEKYVGSAGHKYVDVYRELCEHFPNVDRSKFFPEVR
jgi:hypothetical protein